MATLTIPNTFVNGATIVAAEHNANFTAVKNFVDALSSGTNFDAGAINTEDIATNAITESKIASSAVTSAKIAASVTLTTPNIGVATGTSLSTSGPVTSHLDVNITVGAYTLALTDDGKFVEMNNLTNTNLTVPPESSVNFPTGTTITIVQVGAGQTTLVAGSGVTLNGTPGLKLRAQYSGCVLVKRSSNNWIALGDLSA
jgi:hypothetical protein